MEKDFIDNKLMELKVGENCKIEAKGKEVNNIRERIKRASEFGFTFCFIKLYGDIYYLEKLVEGEKDKFLIKRRNVKKRI